VSDGSRAACERIIARNGLGPLAVFMACGWLIIGPHGALVARVCSVKRADRCIAGLDGRRMTVGCAGAAYGGR
jgi:diaminopimelate decarboxylase